MDQALRAGTAIVVDDAQPDVLDLLIGGPWKYQHHHEGHRQNHPRQERVSPDLLELFLQ